MITIELIDNKKINSIIPLLKILNTSISEETLEERLSDMTKEGYQCVGAFDNDKLIGICGLWILTKYYAGKHIEPDNMIILPEYQNQKIGSKMMQWIYSYAKDNDCVASELNCYIDNKAAHKFWEKENY
ncbi:GNAT family N-acetyltransferase, partial [Sulfurovum sp.]|uniref:GNAT family N-acetyltransferase n=1 Tax=Sulfurovum sp. TaxID=1969726 RepID=UPI0026003987